MITRIVTRSSEERATDEAQHIHQPTNHEQGQIPLSKPIKRAVLGKMKLPAARNNTMAQACLFFELTLSFFSSLASAGTRQLREWWFSL